MAKTSPKLVARKKRIQRIRTKSFGTPERPRMRVFRSNRHIYVQIIDSRSAHTLVAARLSTKTDTRFTARMDTFRSYKRSRSVKHFRMRGVCQALKNILHKPG